MLTDYHCHILPQIDDGAKSTDISLQMLNMLKAQGVERIIATPHFYAHREESITAYLAKRQTAYEKLADSSVLLGAEVAVEHGISKLPDIEKLCLADTKYMLLELPYTSFSSWMLEEIQNIAYTCQITPVLAHIHRYLYNYSKSEMTQVLNIPAILQFNNASFRSFKERRFVRSLIKEGYPYVFGSDCHNLTDRKPDWNLLSRSRKILSGAENLL